MSESHEMALSTTTINLDNMNWVIFWEQPNGGLNLRGLKSKTRQKSIGVFLWRWYTWRYRNINDRIAVLEERLQQGREMVMLSRDTGSVYIKCSQAHSQSLETC